MQGTPSQQLADLYREYGPSLYRRARALTGEPEEALDILQATFLQLHADDDAEAAARYGLALYTLTTHKAVDRLRRRAVEDGDAGLA
jgi:DNA-directed RNA polymerase specialized sigma24 family protein